MTDPQGGRGAKPADSKASPVRLMVLLGILAVAAAALAYDQLMAKPGALAANTKLEDEVRKLNAMGFDDSLTLEEKAKLRDERYVNPQKVQSILQQKPTWTDVHDDYAVEYYCWWGRVPFLNKRHFVTVVYFGKDPNLRYNTHHQNTAPPDESLPGYQHVDENATLPEGGPPPVMGGGMPPAGIEPGASPGGTGKGKGKGKGGKGKGGGLPPPGYSSEDESAPAQPAETKDAPSPAKEPSDDAPKTEDKPVEDKPADGSKTAEKSNEDSAEKKSDE